MPWRKYPFKDEKYGPSYKIAGGVRVRRDARQVWAVYVSKDNQRKNVSIGQGREGLAKAIRVGEAIVAEMRRPPITEPVHQTPGSTDFRAYSEAWLDGGKIRWRETTWQRYEQILRIHVWPSSQLKNKPINEIHRRDVKELLSSVGKKRSPVTVEAVHSVLHGVFKEAVEDELMKNNPASNILHRIIPPKNERYLKDPDPFEIWERDQFLDTAQEMCSRTEILILKSMVFAGLRLGEALGMTLDSLDLSKRTFHVMRSFKRYDFSRPKTKWSRRFVDLPSFLIDELEEHVDHLGREHPGIANPLGFNLLFPDPREKWKWPYSQRKIQGLTKRICSEAGLRPRNPHDLRHTYATTLLMAHQSPAYVQKQLGHSSISITVDIYGHWFQHQGREGLEDALRPPPI